MTKPTVCTREFHDALKVSACWEGMTFTSAPLQVMPWGEVQEWRQCKLCLSTLVRTLYAGDSEAVSP